MRWMKGAVRRVALRFVFMHLQHVFLHPLAFPPKHLLKNMRDVIHQIDRFHAQVDPKPQALRQIGRMLQIALDYERVQIQLAHSQRALEIRQAEYELKVKRAAQCEKRDKERAEERRETAERKAPRDFDNSERIAQIREAHFRRVNSPENMARVDAALAKAEAHLDPDNNPNIIRQTLRFVPSCIPWFPVLSAAPRFYLRLGTSACRAIANQATADG